jgi:acid stress-induced BolA-like protein IbaG/YrbA
VYRALGELMGREIHALSIEAYTLQEWAARSAGTTGRG